MSEQMMEQVRMPAREAENRLSDALRRALDMRFLTLRPAVAGGITEAAPERETPTYRIPGNQLAALHQVQLNRR
ncbi:MAG: hypothetical protein MR021_06630 [Clostridiales bacterium]|nr:hypothetical protein [Clostridiales bacterium]